MNGSGRKVGLALFLFGLAVSGFQLPAQPPEPPRPLPAGVPSLGPALDTPPAPSKKLKLPARTVALQRPSSSELEREETQLFHPLLRLELPGPQYLFRLESEDRLRERLRQEAKQRPGGVARGTLEFPDDRITLSKEPFPSRYWPQQLEVVEPYYVAYRKLYFNQINMSRYGWDMGVLAPLFSAGTFFVDFASVPLQILSDPCRCFEYNTGYFLPGDPVPFLLYPPRAK